MIGVKVRLRLRVRFTSTSKCHEHHCHQSVSDRLPVAPLKNFVKDMYITSKDELILYPKEGKEHRTAYGARKKFRYKCDCSKEKLGDGKCDNDKSSI